ncbi:MAG: aminotransferase class V-fold PLP-dependent enzyme [Bryobacteraceae bacterium]|nr:aminotransferase class V-fold PLP-dependent enzyme [Bryobacteraceae bacterium]
MNRRDAVALSLFGVAARGLAADVRPLPDPALLEKDPEKYWLQVRREQFLLPGWRAFLNNGSLGVAPRPVVRAVTDYLETAAALVHDEYPRWGYEELDAERAEMAAFVGCKKEELAFTHCATEAMSVIANGIDLRPGDEVLITDHEHPSGIAPWALRAQRHGISVREAKIPHPPQSPEQLADILISAIGPRTRVLSFSGILSPTGVLMPVREICRAARAKGVLTVVDGAHMNGQVPFRIADLECDYFAGSPHKWMFAPAGCGLLYIREEHLDRHWPVIVTGDWDRKELKAARFMKIGTNNRAIIAGMMAGKRFLEALGPEKVYARIHELARRVHAMAKQRPYLKLLSSGDDRLYGALVTVTFPEKFDFAQLWRKARERRIWLYGSQRLRISTPIHLRMSDIEAAFELFDEVAGHRAA